MPNLRFLYIEQFRFPSTGNRELLENLNSWKRREGLTKELTTVEIATIVEKVL